MFFEFVFASNDEYESISKLLEFFYRMLSHILTSEQSKASERTGTFFQIMSKLENKNDEIFVNFFCHLISYTCRSGSFPSAKTLTFLYSSLMIAQCLCR